MRKDNRIYTAPAQMPSAINLSGRLGRDGEVATAANLAAALFFSLDFGHIVPGEAAHRSLAALNYLEIVKAEKVAHGYRVHSGYRWLGNGVSEY